MLTMQTTLATVKETPNTIRTASQPSEIYEHIKDSGKLAQETFNVITLNAKNQIIDIHMITLGILDTALVHPREVFRVAILDNAKSIIIFHNHPSGECQPSASDIKVTQQLIKAGEIMKIAVIDHLIISPNNTFYSFREEQTLDFTIKENF